MKRGPVSPLPDNIMPGGAGMDDGRELGNDIQRDLVKKIKIDTTIAEANGMVNRVFDAGKFKPRITQYFGYAGVTAEIKQDSKDWAKRQIRRLVKREEDELIQSQRSVNISKKKGSKGKADGITDLAPDLADMISQHLRKTKISYDVSRRIKQGMTKKKKRSKKGRKKTRKKRRRSKRS